MSKFDAILLLLELPDESSSVSLPRRLLVDGTRATDVALLLDAAHRAHLQSIVIPFTPGPSTPVEALHFEVDEIVASIAPTCPICNDPLDYRHFECDKIVVRYLSAS